MRAATIRDGRIVIEEHPDPEPGPWEVLVRIRAAALNGADLMQVQGGYPPPHGWPEDIPGMDLAGEVAARGRFAERFGRGERVMGIVGGGAQAELAVVDERDALFTQAGLRPGERLLVHGAAGGVGTAAVQLGRTAGARVVATVRNEDCHERVAALGAKVVVPEAYVDEGPFDVVLELVGAPNLADNIKALATGGRIAIIGVGAGFKADLNLLALMGKRGRIHGSTLRPRPMEEKALAARRVERHVLPLVERGEIEVPVAETFPLDRAAEAYDRFAAGGKVGKIVLLVD